MRANRRWKTRTDVERRNRERNRRIQSRKIYQKFQAADAELWAAPDYVTMDVGLDDPDAHARFMEALHAAGAITFYFP